MENKIKKYLNKINLIKAKIDFVNHYKMYRNLYPISSDSSYTLKDTDLLIINTSRYSKRIFYFSKRILDYLSNNSRCDDSIISNEESIMVKCDDDIFFDFDAFIFSCKSIFEESSINKSKEFNEKVKKHFDKLANETNKEFIQPFLKNIRNEVVHLNNLGTAIDSLMTFDFNEDKTIRKISIRTNFKYNNGESVDLISLFFFIFDEVYKIIQKLLGIYILHYYETFGVPQKDEKYCINEHHIFLKDFDIPGYNGIDLIENKK